MSQKVDYGGILKQNYKHLHGIDLGDEIHEITIPDRC